MSEVETSPSPEPELPNPAPPGPEATSPTAPAAETQPDEAREPAPVAEAPAAGAPVAEVPSESAPASAEPDATQPVSTDAPAHEPTEPQPPETAQVETEQVVDNIDGDSVTIHPYNLFVQDRVTRARMPTLEVINDRFSRLLRAALFQHLRKTVDVSSGTIEVVKHAQLLEGLDMPSHLVLVGLRPLRGTMLLVAEKPLVVAIVESRFGGNGRFPTSMGRREFTPVEQKVMRRVTDLLLEQLTAAWQRVIALQSEVVRYEFNPQFASIATSSELIITNTFRVRVDNDDGVLQICIPMAMLEPLRDQLLSGIVSDATDADGRWYELLKSGVEQVVMPLRVELAQIEMTVRELLDLSPGDVFEIDRPQSVVIETDGLPLFRGRWGRYGRKSAVRIDEAISTLNEVLTEKMSGRSAEHGG
jgi:flagellar motor switch protein FliM